MHRRTILNLALGAALILLTAKAALACFWDRDTLAQEAAGLPGVVEVLLGRIDRWPPEYYAMRLERVTRQLESEPNNLELYDDAAVASDRLNRYDEAVEWMARKRAILDTLPESDPARTEHEYRYLANLGTHHAHRWIANGGSADDLTDLERAIELIRAAINLNPDAHFGREKVQLGFLETLRYTRTEGKDELRLPVGVFANEETNPEMLREAVSRDGGPATDEDLAHQAPWIFLFSQEFGFLGSEVDVTPEEAVEGLVGLMTLGDAWASIDAHESLALALMRHDQRYVTAYLAAMRSVELHSSGSRSLLHPDRDPGSTLTFGHFGLEAVSHARDVENYFDRTRALVDQINAERLAFIDARLAEGKHPDTHTDFWDGYEQRSIPELPGRWRLLNVRLYIIAFGLLIFSPFLIVAVQYWRSRKILHTVAWLAAGLVLVGGPTAGLLAVSHYMSGGPGDSQRWQSYDTFRAAMQSNQP